MKKNNLSNSSSVLPVNRTHSTTTAAIPTIDVPLSANIPAPFDFDSLIIPANFGEKFGVTKVITNIAVRKPTKTVFVYIKSGDNIQVFIYEDKISGITYVLTPEIAEIVHEAARRVELHRAVDRQGNQFLIPVTLPGEDGRRNLWSESLMQAIFCGEKAWVRIVANIAAGAYDVYQAKGALGEPEWSDHSMKELVEIAFRGKVISSENDTVIQQLQGAI